MVFDRYEYDLQDKDGEGYKGSFTVKHGVNSPIKDAVLVESFEYGAKQ